MSENLFRIQSMGQTLVTWWFWAFLLFIIAFFSYYFISECFETRKRKAEKELRETKENSRDKIYELNMESIDAEKERKEEIVQQILEIEENEKTSCEYLEKDVVKYKLILNKVENIKFIQYVSGVVCLIIFFITFILSPFVGGSFSNLNKVDYEEMNLKVTAYYVVSYKNVDQITLTVFVKNNSDKSLRSAQITQKGTNNTSFVRNLDSGEEKIVTIDTYTGDNYEFIFENIEFVE